MGVLVPLLVLVISPLAIFTMLELRRATMDTGVHVVMP